MRNLQYLYLLACAQFLGSSSAKDEPVKTPSIYEILQKAEVGDFEFDPISGRLDWRAGGNDGVLSRIAEEIVGIPVRFDINRAGTHNGLTVLCFGKDDAIGRYFVRHIPKLPDLDTVARVSKIELAHLLLGLPERKYIEAEGTRSEEWGFIQYLDNGKFRVMIVVLRYDDNDRVIKKWIGTCELDPKLSPRGGRVQ